MQLEDDYTTWDHWWEWNQGPFLRLKEAVHTLTVQTGSDDFYIGATRRTEARDRVRPTEQEVVQIILPALKQAIDATTNRDIQSACLVAMAKIGKDHPDFTLFDVFAPRLREGNQEIRETAALAMGIAGAADARVVELLAGLVHDSNVGRAARGGRVEDRTRSFAAYALGLLAHGSTRIAVRQSVAAALRAVVDDARMADRDLMVAAIHGLGLLGSGTRTYADVMLRDQAVATLTRYFRKDLAGGDQLIQAHCPTAIARLLGADHHRRGFYQRLFADELADGARRANLAIAQSCALALGQLGRPGEASDADETDGHCNELLRATWRTHRDVQTRCFSLIALAQIGGAGNRAVLLREFDQAKTQQRPWCALALGVSAFLADERSGARGSTAPDALLVTTLTDALQQAKEPGLVGALAIGLGLCRATDAADLLRERLVENVAKQSMAGYLAVGLALMNDVRSIEALRNVTLQSLRRPELLRQGAVALGKLGDKRVTEDLLLLLTDGESNLAKLAAVASALGQIGDRRTVAPLVGMLRNEELTALARAFAAAALGGIADRRQLPWNTKVAANFNYRATVATLTDQTAGILDIL